MSLHLFILILHVLGACLVVGVALLAVFTVIKPPLTQPAMDRLGFVGRFGMWASAWQLVTGGILASQEWSEFSGNRLFWTKIAIYVIEGALASQLLAKQARRSAQQIASGQTASGAGLRLAAWFQAGLIVAIAVLGVILVSGGEE